MTFYHIFYTSLTTTFNFRQKFFWINNLINFCATGITSINCNLNTRFNLTTSCNNTFQGNQRTNLVTLNLPHHAKLLFPRISLSENQSKIPFKLWREAQLDILINLLYSKLRTRIPLRLSLNARTLIILPPLCHDNIMWALHLRAQVNRRQGDDLVDNLRKKGNIPHGICSDPVDKRWSPSRKMHLKIGQLDINYFYFSVCNLL